jgi:hypothetical protein
MMRGRLVVSFALAALAGAAACSNSVTSTAPIGHGDHLIVDVEASTYPPQPTGPTDDYDGAFSRVDGSSIYGTRYDAYAALTVCGPSDGGMSQDDGGASPDDDAMPDDAAAASYPADGASDNGCVPFPAACASTPDCECLFGAFKAQIPCPYPSCGIMKHGFSIYCPP